MLIQLKPTSFQTCFRSVNRLKNEILVPHDKDKYYLLNDKLNF